jgi:hypothetical protein
MEFLRKLDPESPSHSDPDFSADEAKRHPMGMVPAGKGFFQKIFAQVPAALIVGLVAKGPLGRVR